MGVCVQVRTTFDIVERAGYFKYHFKGNERLSRVAEKKNLRKERKKQMHSTLKKKNFLHRRPIESLQRIAIIKTVSIKLKFSEQLIDFQIHLVTLKLILDQSQ